MGLHVLRLVGDVREDRESAVITAPDLLVMDRISAAVARSGLRGTARGVAAACCDAYPRRDPAEVIAAVAKLLGGRDCSRVRDVNRYARAMLLSIDLELSQLVEWAP